MVAHALSFFIICHYLFVFFFFFFNDTATTEIYTLSLHDALPIYRRRTFDRLCIPRAVVLPGRSSFVARRAFRGSKAKPTNLIATRRARARVRRHYPRSPPTIGGPPRALRSIPGCLLPTRADRESHRACYASSASRNRRKRRWQSHLGRRIPHCPGSRPAAPR